MTAVSWSCSTECSTSRSVPGTCGEIRRGGTHHWGLLGIDITSHSVPGPMSTMLRSEGMRARAHSI
jgi:hypothetical protein